MNREQWPELMCCLCGLIVMFNKNGSVTSYPSKCPSNAGGDHIHPNSKGAKRAKEIHVAWLKNPFTSEFK